MRKEIYGYYLPVGMKPQDIISKAEEIKYATGASHIDFTVVGKRVDMVLYFGDLPINIPYSLPDLSGYRLPIPIGYNLDGKLIMLEMGGDAHPFLLVGGNPGTGKSSFLNGCIACLAQFPPEVVRFVFIDLKMGVEMGDWFNLPHKWLKAEDPTMPELKYTLTMILTEIKERMKLFNKAGVRKLTAYNQIAKQKLNYIFMVIDEYAELKNSDEGKDYEDLLQSILQMGRAAGVRCIAATQRPTVDCISGTIKAVFTDRLAFAVSSALNSRVILDTDGAEEIPSDIPGRAIFLTGSKYQTIQVMNYETSPFLYEVPDTVHVESIIPCNP